MDVTRVSEIMTKDRIHTTFPEATVEEAAREMKKIGKGCLLVVGKGGPVGIVTERDLVQKVLAEKANPSKTLVSGVMSAPVISVGPEALISDAAKIMSKNRIRRLVVTEGGRVMGILTVTDMARHLRQRQGRDPVLEAMARGREIFAEARSAR